MGHMVTRFANQQTCTCFIPPKSGLAIEYARPPKDQGTIVGWEGQSTVTTRAFLFTLSSEALRLSLDASVFTDYMSQFSEISHAVFNT
jgi:hypothetical protein